MNAFFYILIYIHTYRFHLEKGQGGKLYLGKKCVGVCEGSACNCAPSMGGTKSRGIPPHTNLNFIPSEITSGAFSDSFVVLKYMMR